MALNIYLGPEVATLPACDDLEEVAAMIFAIDKVREQHRLPAYRWSPAELVELGVPLDIAESVGAMVNVCTQGPELVARTGKSRSQRKNHSEDKSFRPTPGTKPSR